MALLLQNPATLPRLHGALDPGYFTEYHLGVIVREILTYFGDYGKVPEAHHIRDRLISLAGVEKARGVVTCLDELCRLTISNQEEIERKIWRFGQRQNVFTAMQEILGMAKEDKDLSPSADLLRRALDKSGTSFNPGVDYRATLPGLQQDLADSALYNPSLKIPFGHLDELNRLTHGGIGEKELFVVGATAKKGKTSLLTYVGANAAWKGHNVLHVSFESKEIDCRVNYTSLFTGWTRNQIAAREIPDMTNALLQQTQMLAGGLRIAYFPPETMGISALKSWVMQLRTAYSFIPKLIIIDYPDRMKLDNPNDVYNSLGRLYDGIITMLDELCMHGLAATQLNRGADRAESSGGDAVTDSWKKIANLDGFITINQTAGEYDQGTARLRLDRTRRGIGGKEMRVSVDHSRCMWSPFQEEAPNVAQIT